MAHYGGVVPREFAEQCMETSLLKKGMASTTRIISIMAVSTEECVTDINALLTSRYRKTQIDPFDRHYEMKLEDLEKDKLSGEQIYKVLVYFDKFYGKMEDTDKQRFFKSLIKEIQIYEEPAGKQWLKSIKFTFPLLGESDDDALLKFTVIISKAKDKWVFCKHKEIDNHAC